MFSLAEHIAKAHANEAFAQGLAGSGAVETEWAITVLFYAAVHYVQGYFAQTGRSFTTHGTRASAIQRDVAIKRIYDDYRELESISREARYDCSSLTRGHFKYAGECLERVKAILVPLCTPPAPTTD